VERWRGFREELGRGVGWKDDGKKGRGGAPIHQNLEPPPRKLVVL
jgi:hypothetical protein